MNNSVRLYPSVKVTGRSFVGVKRVTMPNQSLSLREIVQRFIRRESLPVSHEGLYEDRFGDLEKLSRQDIVVQMERVEELKAQIDAFNKREIARAEAAEKAAADAKVAAAQPVVPASGASGGVAPAVV